MVAACLSRVSTFGKIAISGLTAVSVASYSVGNRRVSSVANSALAFVGGLECMKCAFQGCLRRRKCTSLCTGLFGLSLSLVGLAHIVVTVAEWHFPRSDDCYERSIEACNLKVDEALNEIAECPEMVEYLTPPEGMDPPNVMCVANLDPQIGVQWEYKERVILVSKCIKEHLRSKLLNGLVALSKMAGMNFLQEYCRTHTPRSFAETMEKREWLNIQSTIELAKKCKWIIPKLPYWQHFEFPYSDEDWTTSRKYMENSEEHSKLYENLWMVNCQGGDEKLWELHCPAGEPCESPSQKSTSHEDL